MSKYFEFEDIVNEVRLMLQCGFDEHETFQYIMIAERKGYFAEDVLDAIRYVMREMEGNK